MTSNNSMKVKIFVLVILYVYGEIGFSRLYDIIKEKIDITKGGLYYHLEQLSKEGLISCRNTVFFLEGHKRKCKLTEKGLKELEEIKKMVDILDKS